MRIALVIPQFFPFVGGAEVAAHQLAQAWQRQGHDVCVCNHSTSTAPLHALYTVKKYSLLKGSTRLGDHRFPFSWYTVRQLEALLASFQPDFISAHYGFPTAVWLSKISGLPPYTVTCHGMDLNEHERPRRVFKIDRIMADALNRATKVIAISSRAAELLAEIGVAPDKTVRIPNGIDTAHFARAAAFNIRTHYGIPDDAPLILCVGRNNWAKDHDTGIAALALLHKRIPDAHCLMLGKDTRFLNPLAVRQGLEQRVIFDELYDERLTAAYQQADVFFSSSISELCPVSVLEAMAAGLPAVVTDIGAHRDLIQNSTNGILVPPTRPQAMSDALDRLITDRTLRTQLGKNSIDIASGYDWQLISSRYVRCVFPGGETA